jgi:hypothetical protein
MNKRLQAAIDYLNGKKDSLSNRKGNQLVAIASGVGAFAIGLITVVLVAVIVAALQNSSSIGAYTVNNSAWIIANNTLAMMVNFSAQLGLAGTVLGFVVIFGGLAYLGYFAYQKTTGGR